MEEEVVVEEEVVEVEWEWIPPLVDQFCPPCSVILVTVSLQRKIERHMFQQWRNVTTFTQVLYSIIIYSTSTP